MKGVSWVGKLCGGEIALISVRFESDAAKAFTRRPSYVIASAGRPHVKRPSAGMP
jgi:hypothetical protein